MKRSMSNPSGRLVAGIVFGIFLLGLVFSTVSVLAVPSPYNPLNAVLFRDSSDSFMDFYRPITFAAAADPYVYVEAGAIYPPVCYVLFRIVGSAFGSGANLSDAFALRESQTGQFLLVLFLLFNVLPLAYLLYRRYRGSEVEKLLFVGITLTSGPYLYLLERGNILLLTFWLTFFFVLLYRSQTVWIRELALLALALAAATKLYPAVFGLLLVMDKRYKEAVRCAVYGLLIFFLPVFSFQGIRTLAEFIQNLSHGVAVTVSDAYRVDWGTTLAGVYGWLGLPAATGRFHAEALLVPALLGMVVCGFWQREVWKKCLSLAMVCVMLPGFSFYYVMIFYLPPLFLLLQDKEHRRIDLLYAVLLAFTGVLFMTGLGFESHLVGMRFVYLQGQPNNWCVEFGKAAQIGLMLTLAADTLKQLLGRRQGAGRVAAPVPDAALQRGK